MNQIIPTMSALENRAMQVLWKHRTCCVHMVKTELETQKAIAYTTVQTILDRLVSKGMAKKHQVDKTAVYTPKITKTTYAHHVLQAALIQLQSEFDEVLVPTLYKTIQQLPINLKQQLLAKLQGN